MRQQFEAVLGQFGDRIGLKGLALDARGGCALEIDGLVTTLVYLPDTDEVLLSCEIGRVERPLPAPLGAILLAANANHALTDGATLGVTADGTVTLARQAAIAGLDAALFERCLERFNDSARVWRANIEDRPRGAGAGEADAGEAGPKPDAGSEPAGGWLRI